MFDIGWSEMAVIALLTLIVIGPKELPRVLRTVGQWVRKAQSLAREFQRGLDDMAREADLEDAKKLVDAGRSIANPKKMVMDTLDGSGNVEEEFKDLQKAMASDTPAGATVGGETADGAAEKKAAAQGDPSDTPAVEKVAATSTKPEKPAAKKAAAKSAGKASGNGAPTQSKSPSSGTKAASKGKPRAEPKAKSEPEPAGSDGSQKTA